MNKKKWIPIALAALTLGACSDDNVSDNGNEPQWNAEGKGYVTLSLNLPTATGVDSKANDEFDDGIASEYAVGNATLLLFTGDDESTATCHSVYEMNLGNWNEDLDDDQITASTKITQAINSYDETNAYALVVLNHNGTITITDENTATLGTEELVGKTWEEIRDLTLSEVPTKSGIMMLNAPLTTAKGGTGASAPSGTVTTLALIDGEKVYQSEAQAATGEPAATIYVERVVAKVSVNDETTEGETLDDTEIKYEIAGWFLDITNKTSYLGHNVEDFSTWLPYTSANLTSGSDYRFAGHTPVETGVEKYRIYWAKDPNYSGENLDNAFDMNVAGTDFNGKTPYDMGDYAYCFENTFNVANMKNNQSTRVIVKAKLTAPEGTTVEEDGTFYTEGMDASVLYDEAGMVKIFKSRLTTDPAFISWAADHVSGGKDAIKEENITVTFDENEEAKGKMVVETITLTGVTYLDKENIPVEIIEEITPDVNVYKNGYAYYPVVIKHFGDAQTPWEAPEIGGAYGDNAEEAARDYLGRYGVVRNNWYDINVDGIAKLGYPSVPPVDGGEDDIVQNFISVKINILSWAKRTQGVTLGD